MSEQLLRGATVVDGTGGPARAADVRIAGDEIVEVGPDLRAGGAEVVDLDGLVLAPGFIDIHTHYDAQILWDPDLTPSSWHGVTTVVMGNCGFGIAPTRPDDRGTIARTLENVEGMSVEALAAGIDWQFETFPQYLDALDARPSRLNVAAFIGHTPVRLYVLGGEATDRTATDAEVAEMRRIVGEALDAGAVGFATSKATTHAGDGGKPVPSRLAEFDEIRRIGSAMSDRGRGVLQATIGPKFYVDELAGLSNDLGRPVTWTALLTGTSQTQTATEVLARSKALSANVFPQVACRPLVFQITMADPFPFATVPAFSEVLAVERADRGRVLADPAWRARARPDFEKFWGPRMAKCTISETVVHEGLVDGPSITELAARMGTDVLSALCDLALADELRTRLRVVMLNDDEDEVGALLADDQTILGLSDAGAHASQLCDACFSTHLLGHWVRERRALSLERAVWRLAGQPAALFGFDDRGTIAVGRRADLVAFDPATVGTSRPWRAYDLPAGADRILVDSVGLVHMWVNGVATRRDGAELDGLRPGRLLRAGR
jgi:N-acyl-D-amino-acid deacylase